MAEIFQETKRYLHKKNNKKENSKTRQNKGVKTPPPNKRKKNDCILISAINKSLAWCVPTRWKQRSARMRMCKLKYACTGSHYNIYFGPQVQTCGWASTDSVYVGVWKLQILDKEGLVIGKKEWGKSILRSKSERERRKNEAKMNNAHTRR